MPGSEPTIENYDEKPVKSAFDPAGYDKDLVESLERDIVQKNPNVKWLVIVFVYNCTYQYDVVIFKLYPI